MFVEPGVIILILVANGEYLKPAACLFSHNHFDIHELLLLSRETD